MTVPSSAHPLQAASAQKWLDQGFKEEGTETSLERPATGVTRLACQNSHVTAFWAEVV